MILFNKLLNRIKPKTTTFTNTTCLAKILNIIYRAEKKALLSKLSAVLPPPEQTHCLTTLTRTKQLFLYSKTSSLKKWKKIHHCYISAQIWKSLCVVWREEKELMIIMLHSQLVVILMKITNLISMKKWWQKIYYSWWKKKKSYSFKWEYQTIWPHIQKSKSSMMLMRCVSLCFRPKMDTTVIT